jgi:hypothetical protein
VGRFLHISPYVHTGLAAITFEETPEVLTARCECIHCYAALSNPRAEVPAGLMSDTYRTRSVTPAAIAGVIRRVWWMRTKL